MFEKSITESLKMVRFPRGSDFVLMMILVLSIQSCTATPETEALPKSTCTVEPRLYPTTSVPITKPSETPQPTPTTKIEPPSAITEVGQAWINPVDGAEMVGVPAGEFRMGTGNGYEWEGPEHTVYLDPYYIDKLEITNAQYRACEEAGKCVELLRRDYIDDPDLDQHPVVNVTWHWAKKYCKWAGKRLPTEAEWEKSARGTDGRRYPWGDEIDCEHAHYKDCGGETIPVGSLPAGASPYGALDMAGNVWEWVIDGWQEDYYQVSPYENPQGPEIKGPQDMRVFRGGSWSESGDLLRSTYRTWYETDAQYYNLGFRCVMDAP